MADATQLPSVEERQAFAQKLGRFREGLTGSEQRMLDTMVAIAFAPAREDEVQPFSHNYYGPQFVPSTSSGNPAWYNGSGAAAWNGTQWGVTIGGLQSYYPT
jgi:hypothetical protein